MPIVGGMVDLAMGEEFYDHPYKQVELLEQITGDILPMGEYDLSSQPEQLHTDDF